MNMAGNDIFHIISTEISEGQITANVSVNSNTEIFKGHFPGQPVVPGACIVQLVKVVLEKALGKNLILKKAANIKFSQMIVPRDEQTLVLIIVYKTIDDRMLSVNAKLSENDTVCFKLQGSFTLI